MFVQFVLVLLVTIVTMLSALEDSFAPYVDVTMRVDLNGRTDHDIEALQLLLQDGIAKKFQVDNLTSGTTVCVQLMVGDLIGELNVDSSINASAVKDLVDRMTNGSMSVNGSCLTKRRGAHQALIEVMRVEIDNPSGGNLEDEVRKRNLNRPQELRRQNLTALVVFKKRTNASAPFTVCYVFVDTPTVIEVSRQPKEKTEFSNEAGKKLWQGLQDFLSHQCNYEVTVESICYYVDGTNCVQVENITRKIDQSSPYTYICAESRIRPGAKCKKKKNCNTECQRRLNEAPCLPGCGVPGFKNLSANMDDLTKYCPVKELACNEPCPTTVGTTVSAKARSSPTATTSATAKPSSIAASATGSMRTAIDTMNTTATGTTSISQPTPGVQNLTPTPVSVRARVGLALIGAGIGLFCAGGLGLLVLKFYFGRKDSSTKRPVEKAVKTAKASKKNPAPKASKKK